MAQLDKRESPDFSLDTWQYQDLHFFYKRGRKTKQLSLLKDVLKPLSNSEIKREIKLRESDQSWFLTVSFFKDLDVEDYAEKYRGYSYKDSEDMVIGYELCAFGRLVIRGLQFKTKDGKTKKGKTKKLERSFFWFLKPDNTWEEGDVGDCFGFDCVFSPKRKKATAIIEILDLYGYIKATIKIKPQK